MENAMLVKNMEAETMVSMFEKMEKSIINKVSELVKPPITDKLLTRKEVGKMLKISLPTVSAWTKAGVLKSRRKGNKLYYSENEILKSERK